MDESIFKIVYREGELENLLRVRNNFVNLIEQYSDDSIALSRSKLLGSLFDTVFFIGICSLRKHKPSVKEVYLNIGDSKNSTLRNLELLEELKIVLRIQDCDDCRVKRITLTEQFKKDFEVFVERWIDSRKNLSDSIKTA